ncbi:MAG: hypothetical protein JXA03_12165 [Bacteroidales bacterium]|nr:hypothetical protein [Bacteroidales bacterium]
MKRLLPLLCVALLCRSVPLTAQGKLSVKPLTPAGREQQDVFSPDNFGMLHLPCEFNYSEYYRLKKDLSKDLPAAYDLRTAGPGGTSLVSAVKGQQSCGACWAFATYGSIESYLMTLGMGEYDFSENNLKNCSGFDPLPCQWGHHFMSTAYLMRRSGPISEADDPYVPLNQSCNPGYTPMFHFTDSRYPPDELNALKQVIYEYGGVYTTMRFKLDFYNPADYTYCDTIGTITSHAVTLVGWDDNKFVTGGPLSPPNGRVGAFIAKNSRGPTFGEQGFFYVAYDDNLIKKYCSFWPGFRPYDSTLYIYQYDTIGGWPFVGYEDSVAYALVKFTAPETHLISGVGTYTVSYGTTLDFDFYENFDGSALSGWLGSLPARYCEMPGFHSFDLPEPLRMGQGNDFFIRIRHNSPGEDYPIVVEGVDPGYSSPFVETGKCWTSPDGLTWEACGTGTPNEFDLCVKVYAHAPFLLDLKVFLEGPFGGQEMNTALNGGGFVPLSQPYNLSPWNYQGQESVASLPSGDIVDWLLIELRETSGDASTATTATIAGRVAAFLMKDGAVRGINATSLPVVEDVVTGNLYVALYHRNHLSVMSSQPLGKSGNTYSYDFSTGYDRVFGGQGAYRQLASGIYGMMGGDGSANGQVNNGDKNDVWVPQAGSSGYKAADFDMDTQVSNPDKNDIWIPNSGYGTQVPQ